MPQTEEMSVEEYRKLTAKSKYGNTKIDVDGITFDSIAEARRYKELCLLESAGAISDLRLQPRYELQRRFIDIEGKAHQAICYIGDFSYIESGDQIVEDVKGMATAVFKLKQKLFQFKYPHIYLRIIK